MTKDNKSRGFGDKLLAGMSEFTEALQKKEFSKLTIRTIKLDLEPTPYNPKLVVETREVLGVSQALFAQFLGVSLSTVSAWEQGDNKPQDMACRFMDEIRHNPGYWRERLMSSVVEKEPA